MIKKCIIPAAGFGTRFLPATKSLPKEMLPIIDTPVIQLLVEEAISAGITDIIFITNRHKKSLEDHFDVSFELEKILESKNKTKDLELITKISKMANFYFIRQPNPNGDWDALLRAKELIGDEPCLVLFGDDLVKWEITSAEQLVKAYNEKKSPIIALERVKDEKVSSYGIVESNQNEWKIYQVSKFLEKPKPTETNSRLGVIGKYVITPEVFDYLLQGGGSASKDGEIRLADAFANMVNDDKKIFGLEIEWNRYDTGDKLGFLKATVDYALDREDIGEEFYNFLKEKFGK